jgi:hypothetical protein
MAGSFKMFLWDWNPVRNRRLLINSQLALANCQNAWANTHIELLEAKDKCIYLRAEIERLERLSHG